MNNYTGVWSLGRIIDFIERNHMGGVFKSRQFKNQCYNLIRKIPFYVYDVITRCEGIDPIDMDNFEKDYQDYLFEYDRYIYRKENGVYNV